jgi:hypothetical protein
MAVVHPAKVPFDFSPVVAAGSNMERTTALHRSFWNERFDRRSSFVCSILSAQAVPVRFSRHF